MSKYFDEKKWEQYISQSDWYLKLSPEHEKLKELRLKEPSLNEEIKESIYTFFEKHLAEGSIVLGKSGPDWDEERESIDTIVIHHTGNPPGFRLERLNALHLINVYAAHYARVKSQAGHLRKKPIWSNHLREGKQVFYSYHWFVRMDGTVERLLNDNEIGWQAGNWDINCRSVAICLDNDYDETSPLDETLENLANLVKTRYPQVKPERIFGHREINPKTICPGNHFLNGWKKELLDKLH